MLKVVTYEVNLESKYSLTPTALLDHDARYATARASYLPLLSISAGITLYVAPFPCQRSQALYLPGKLWLEGLAVSHGTVAALTVNRGISNILGSLQSIAGQSIGNSVGGRDRSMAAAVNGLRPLVMIRQASGFGSKLLKDCMTQ